MWVGRCGMWVGRCVYIIQSLCVWPLSDGNTIPHCVELPIKELRCWSQ